MRTSSVNPLDANISSGRARRYKEYVFPAILGSDSAGVVVETGPGVTRLSPGDRVFAKADRGRSLPRDSLTARAPGERSPTRADPHRLTNAMTTRIRSMICRRRPRLGRGRPPFSAVPGPRRRPPAGWC
ncbi:alcohol dehydrogenase catalytic domain-containing protein [Actinacidiphila oryziradicis]|uniref:Alcohol dehydrogenase-like N-terminal domain-containing protein n=1 Tax=Actinacidiphila oryziradicis TaxID=2571141 RepID=A0A4U0T9A1_9ACTN|nr:alcohol dehydrogenase catalytic domain-containing protein [Actinacidiphila oryziradicis]TKA13335.1 hypothetical protein FCI23_01075 [Actinacidiphila oryziradicis]